MSPPIFPTLQPTPFGPTSYGLTVFQPNQVLSAPQLNDWVSFLMGQEQATRARLLGVGVATGLLPTVAAEGNLITVSAGCGVTTEGLLLRLEAPATYGAYRPIEAELLAPYAPFAGLEILELLPEGSTATGAQPLTKLKLSEYAVAIYQRSVITPTDRCQNTGCDDGGKRYNVSLQVVLVPYPEANSERPLVDPGLIAAATAYFTLPPLAMRRPLLDGDQHATRLQSLHALLSDAADQLGAALDKAMTTLKDVPGFGATSTVRSYVQRAKLRLLATVAQTTDANQQYIYGWLKDLYDAYGEFQQAASRPSWLGRALPAPGEFPRHLVLGECAPEAGLLAPRYRHAWQPAPPVGPAPTAAQVQWLFQRICTLIVEFALPSLVSSTATETPPIVVFPQSTTLSPKPKTLSLSEGGGDGQSAPGSLIKLMSLNVDLSTFGAFTPEMATVATLRLTPDRGRAAGFDRRSIPFYYGAGVRASWSYAQSSIAQAQHILTYPPSAVSGALDFVANPLDYQLESYDFYRIEGLLDAPASVLLSQLATLRDSQNLAFDIVAVSADALGSSQPLLVSSDNPAFTGQQELFGSNLSLLRLEESKASQAGTPLKQALGNVQLTLPTTAFGQLVQDYKQQNGPLPGDIAKYLDALTALNTAYNGLSKQLTFPAFRRANPGMEHGAGVPRGGTFVVVYRAPEGSPNTPLIVGDYYLPHRQSGNGPITQLVLPDPAPLIRLERSVASSNEEGKPEVGVGVSPAGGTLTVAFIDGAQEVSVNLADVIEERGGMQYFQVRKAVDYVTTYASNEKRLIALPHTWKFRYTIGSAYDEKSLLITRGIFIEPFSVGELDSEGIRTFSYRVGNATKLSIDFGDGTHATAVLPLTATETDFTSPGNGPIFSHKYGAIPAGGFKAVLTASNGKNAVQSNPQIVNGG
ncbi:MAG TPA: hypothetical protein VFO93_19440 [Hymenobacter sp.]|uniref:hypothetical protein n=1 Tax=Hymenobacter sp. TaxID=1898978 RepID=UPI002D7E8B38|nr:hypothetical protein [Hymenobacter sp.]HET9505728.1 hypothetical protein [Hymenobacter sp.]